MPSEDRRRVFRFPHYRRSPPHTDIDTVLVRRLQLPLTLGTFDWTIAGHVAFLVVMGMIGVTITARRLDKLLLK